MSKKKRKAAKQSGPLVPSKSMARKTQAINPVVAGVVAVTMMLALVITVLPGAVGNQGSADASRQTISNSAQQRIQALETSLRSSPGDIGTLTQLGNEYFDTGQYGKAIDTYTQVLDKTPDNTNVRTDLGISYFYLGMTNQAIQQYKKALEVEPNKPQTLYNLGIAYVDLSPPDTEGAIAAWQKVIQTNPGTPDATKAQEMIDKYGKR